MTAPRPFAWVLPGDDTASSGGWLDARIDEWSEFTKPLYDETAIATLISRAEQDAKRIEELEAWQRARLEVGDLHLERIEELTEAFRKAGELLEQRANGYADRGHHIFSGRILADEIRANARLIAALQRGGA